MYELLKDHSNQILLLLTLLLFVILQDLVEAVRSAFSRRRMNAPRRREP